MPRLAMLAAVLSILFLGACSRATVDDFQPKRAMVCDTVYLTGSLLDKGVLKYFTLNNVPLKDATGAHWPSPSSPVALAGMIPEGAQSGILRAKIEASGWVVLGFLGLDYTSAQPLEIVGSPPAPVIISFTGPQSPVKEGQPIVLSFSLGPNVTSATINGSPIALGNTTATFTASPNTTSFNLVVFNKCISRSKTVSVNVIPLPKITSLSATSYRPGKTVTVSGAGLARIGEQSALLFTGGATTISVNVTNPTASKISAVVPSGLPPGTVSVKARVGTDESNAKTFNYDARVNGNFTDVKASLGTGGAVCSPYSMTVGSGVVPYDHLATFKKGGQTIEPMSFNKGTIGGAAFSPTCGFGTSLSFNASQNDYTLAVKGLERPGSWIATGIRLTSGSSVTAFPNRWHLLFSPDDKIVIVSAVPAVGPSNMYFSMKDLHANKDFATVFLNCSNACALTAKVIDNSKVQVSLDGVQIKEIPIFN